MTISNNPPDMTVTAAEVAASLNDWLRDHPVIDSREMAGDAKILIDRGKLGIKDLEAERESKVKPLNTKVQQINQTYRGPRDLLQKVINETTRRITDFLAKEEAKRIREAEEARKRAEEAERVAREAEQREREVIAEADVGAIVDVAAAVSDADEAFADYQRRSRAAALAEKEAKVRIGGGFSRALSLRTKESLIVTDAISAINAIGVTPDIEVAILKGARAYRTIHSELPPGIGAKTERTA